MTPAIGVALFASWLICWFFFFGSAQKTTHHTKTNALFAYSTGLVAVLLVVWIYCMWFEPPRLVPVWLLALGALMVVSGQWIMCQARKELPMSTYHMIMRISGGRIRKGLYAHLAHPMYIGLVLALLGSAIVLGNRGATGVLLILVPVLLLRAWIESRA